MMFFYLHLDGGPFQIDTLWNLFFVLFHFWEMQTITGEKTL